MDDFDNEDDDLLLAATLEIDSFSLPKEKEITGDTAVGVKAFGVSLTAPTVFPFPFSPYGIQKDFMKNLYVCLQEGKIGVFESPTGTGKSLSLICGALTWLRDYHKSQSDQLKLLSGSAQEKKDKVSVDQESGKNGMDWITEFARKKEQEEALEKIKKEQSYIQNREAKLKELQNDNPDVKKRKHYLEKSFDDLMSGASLDIKKACMKELEDLEDEINSSGCEEDDGDLMVAEYFSDDEKESKDYADEDEEEDSITKIYYCSRTHSQLSQFVREVMKSPFENVRVVSLGSRQNMCINHQVQKLKSLTLINDKCRELKQKKSKSRPGCPFDKQDRLHVFKDKALIDILDIEQLVSLGRKSKTCPYFGARYAVPAAEIVALPYNTLLHKKTRAACGIKLAGSVIIIDEAHNLLETINSIHSIEISGAQVIKAHSQLSQYERKFKGRLKAKNLMYVKQILFVLSNLAVVMGGKVEYVADSQRNSKEEVSLLTINDFLFRGQFDNMNMFKLLRYCQRSSISKKNTETLLNKQCLAKIKRITDDDTDPQATRVCQSLISQDNFGFGIQAGLFMHLHGFVEKYKDDEVQLESEKRKDGSGLTKFLDEIKSSKNQGSTIKQEDEASARPVWMSSPLMHIESFLEALTNANQDGRVVLSKQMKVSASSLKFLMLNPAVSFGSVLSEARAVVVAGGTMQPVEEFKEQLFYAAGISPERILEFSCGHVIPATHILPIALSKGPTGLTLDLTFPNRNSPALIEEMGRVLCNLCNIVNGGIVCFFPSYDYENLVYASWEKARLLQRIQNKKKVFREPKGSGMTDQVLLDYSDCIRRCATWQGNLTGAILLCVVGGKMSEGINFSDCLGRCIVMAGLPYPNINSPELKEKMSYLSTHFPKDKEGRTAGQVHYENCCMKAVNQSIGRAIRHKDDYASIVLLDQRYQRPRIISKLPTWISKHVQCFDKFSSLAQAIPKVYREV